MSIYQNMEWNDKVSYEYGRAARATTIGSGMTVEDHIDNICQETYTEPHPRSSDHNAVIIYSRPKVHPGFNEAEFRQGYQDKANELNDLFSNPELQRLLSQERSLGGPEDD